MRAFSLAEALVCVAIIGVMAALATPSITDVIWGQRLEGGTETIASAIAAARIEAMTFKRCTRVVVEPRRARVERLNAFDCDNPAPPFIEPGPLWLPVETLTIDEPLVVEQGTPWPPTLPGSGGVSELRFRASGRMFSHDESGALRSRGAVITLRHPRLSGAGATKSVGVQRNGLECVMKRAQTVPIIAGDVVCP